MFELIIFIIIISFVVKSKNKNKKASSKPAPRPAQQPTPIPGRPAQNRPAQNRPAQNRPAQNRPAQNRPQQNRPQQHSAQSKTPQNKSGKMSTTDMLEAKALADDREHKIEKQRQRMENKKHYGSHNYAQKYILGDPVPKGKKMVFCPYCNAENLILTYSAARDYNCYFCREEL